MATKTKNIQRSSGFRDRQTRSLYSRYYRLGAHFKETVLKYEVERSQARRREEKVREKLEELERREAFLEGRKANLLAEKLTREDSSSTSIFMSPPRTSKIRKTEAESIFKDHSGFLDSAVSGIRSGGYERTNMDNSHSSSRERERDPAMEYLLHLTNDSVKVDSDLLPMKNANSDGR